MSSPTEKRIFFDIHFTAKNPLLSTKNVLVMLHIDFEIQNNYVPSNPKYPITKRAIYYAARELSAQLGIATNETNYDKLEKVYSIWICNENIPDKLKNSITRYHIEKEDIMGTCDESDVYHNLMEVIIVRRGKEALENTLFEYLQGVFTTNFDTINKYVDVDNNNEVKEVLETMTGLGESLERESNLKMLISLVTKGLLTIEQAAKEIGLSAEEFLKKMNEN